MLQKSAQEKIKLPDNTQIKARVGIGPIATGFGINAELNISLPGLAKEVADNLVAKAHSVCPYSNATRGNIEVTLNVLV